LISGTVPVGDWERHRESATCLYETERGPRVEAGREMFSTFAFWHQAIAEPSGSVFTRTAWARSEWRTSSTEAESDIARDPFARAGHGYASALSARISDTVNGSNSNHWIYVDSASGERSNRQPVLTRRKIVPRKFFGTISFSVAIRSRRGYALEAARAN